MDYAGGAPYWFSAGFPACAHSTIMTMPPTQGMSTKSCSQPLFPVSCMRREPAAYNGIASTIAKTNTSSE